MASIQKRVSGGKVTHRVRWRDPAGRQLSRSFPTLALARAYQSTVEADLLRGTYLDLGRGQMTLGEYAAEWLAVQTFGLTTRERREHDLRLHILPALGHHRLTAVRPTVVQAWVRGLSERLAPQTVLLLLRLLSSIMAAAVDDDRVLKNPCKAASVRVPRPDAKPYVPWTPEQIAALQRELPERYRLVLTFATGLGLRQGEIFGLAVDDIDFLRRVVTVRRQVIIFRNQRMFALPKGRKVRTVPLPSSVADQIAAHLQRYPAREVTLPLCVPRSTLETARLLVTTIEGNALNRNCVNAHVWKPALGRAGLPLSRDFMTHGGRHFYASLQLEHGISPRALADYLGHSDPAFTMRVYAHLMPEAGAKAQAAVDAVFNGISAAQSY
ncbi:MAG: site-specific integrase [Propionibacteriales bacterium]|nr:site-specific integrase [Propionibacteriales bacterium]